MTDPASGSNSLIKFRGLLPEFSVGRAISAIELWWRGGDTSSLRFKASEDFSRHNLMMELEQHETFLNARDIFRLLDNKLSDMDYIHKCNCAYKVRILNLDPSVEARLRAEAEMEVAEKSPHLIRMSRQGEEYLPESAYFSEYQELRVQWVKRYGHQIARGYSPLCFAVDGISYNATTRVQEDILLDREYGLLVDWSSERIQVDPRNGELLDQLRDYEAEISIGLRIADRDTAVPDEFKKISRLAEAGALQRDPKTSDQWDRSYDSLG